MSAAWKVAIRSTQRNFSYEWIEKLESCDEILGNLPKLKIRNRKDLQECLIQKHSCGSFPFFF